MVVCCPQDAGVVVVLGALVVVGAVVVGAAVTGAAVVGAAVTGAVVVGFAPEAGIHREGYRAEHVHVEQGVPLVYMGWFSMLVYW